MRRSRKINQRKFGFEALENRTLLAGNVSASVDSGGDLVLQGDAASNAIQLTQIGADTWKVTGIATTVNGTHTYIARGVTRRIGAFMDQGNNTVQFLSGNALGIDFEGLNGNDALLLNNITVSDRVNVDTGDGTNSVVINNCNISDSLGISMGNNNDAVAITHTTINGGLLVELGNGTNALTMVNDNVVQPAATFTVQPLQDSIDIPDCGAVIVGGSGVDAIVMSGVKIDCFTQIDTLGGNDSVVIANSRFGNLVSTTAPFVQPLDAADDPVLVDPTLNDIFVGLYIQTGTGNDATSIANTTVYGELHIDSSNQLDPLGRIALSTPVKDGNDSVALAKVTVLYDGADPSTENNSDSGELWVFTGNQSDAVALASVITDGDAWISTTDFSLTPSNLDGADSVAIANSSFNRLDQQLIGTEVDGITIFSTFGLDVITGNGNDTVSIANVKTIAATIVETDNGTDHVAISSLAVANTSDPSDDLLVDLGDGNYDTLSVVNSSSASAQFYGGGNTGDTLVKAGNHFGSETDTGFQYVIG